MKLIFLLVSLFFPIIQQPNYNLIYDERLQNKPGQVQEQNLIIMVNNKNPEYKAFIKDTEGKNSYRLACYPIFDKEQKQSIIAWDLCVEKKTLFGWKDVLNVDLKDIADSIEEEDVIGWLFPAADKTIMGERFKSSLAPSLFTKRVVKIKQFYCIFKVEDFTFSNKDTGTLDSMKVDVSFTNQYSGPRQRAYQIQ